MNHLTEPAFWAHYHRLPDEVRARAEKNFELLKADPQHPSLRLKRIGRLWSVRVGRHWRALGLDKGGNVVWFWIGADVEYERLLRQQ